MLQRADKRPIRSTRCQFVMSQPTNEPRALFAGEYPPTGSKADAPHANPTGMAISKCIGLGRHDWCDLVPYAPVDTPSGKIDRRALEAHVRADRALQSDWISRISERVVECGAAGMAISVVYVAGRLCNDTWASTSHERFQLVSTVSESLGVHMYKTGTTECLVMLQQPHPSWVLVSHGDPSAVESFQRAMSALNALLSDRDGRVTLNEARLLETMTNIERLRRERRSLFMARIGIADEAWPAGLGHLQNAPYDNDEFVEQLDELLGYGLSDAQLRRVMSLSLFNRPLDRSARDALKYWAAKLGAKLFAKFMCGSVASALASPGADAFEARLDRWLAKLGPKRFVTFMCGGVAAAFVSTGADSFEERLDRWLAKLGPKRFATFMCDSVAAAFVSTGAVAFEERLEQLLAVMCVPDFVKLMRDGIACRTLDDQFFASLIACFARRNSVEERQMLLKFMPRCCASIKKLGAAEFWRRVDAICVMMPRPTQAAALCLIRAA